MVSDLTFKSFDVFWIYSCVWGKIVVQFPFHVAAQFSQHHLLKILFFPHCIFLSLLCHELIYQICLSLFLSFLFCSVDLSLFFMPIPYYFIYCSFVMWLEFRKYNASSFVLPSQDALAILESCMSSYIF